MGIWYYFGNIIQILNQFVLLTAPHEKQGSTTRTNLTKLSWLKINAI